MYIFLKIRDTLTVKVNYCPLVVELCAYFLIPANLQSIILVFTTLKLFVLYNEPKGFIKRTLDIFETTYPSLFILTYLKLHRILSLN